MRSRLVTFPSCFDPSPGPPSPRRYSHCCKCAMREGGPRPTCGRRLRAGWMRLAPGAPYEPGLTVTLPRRSPDFRRGRQFHCGYNAFRPINVADELCSLVVLRCPFSAFPGHSINEKPARRGRPGRCPCWPAETSVRAGKRTLRESHHVLGALDASAIAVSHPFPRESNVPQRRCSAGIWHVRWNTRRCRELSLAVIHDFTSDV